MDRSQEEVQEAMYLLRSARNGAKSFEVVVGGGRLPLPVYVTALFDKRVAQSSAVAVGGTESLRHLWTGIVRAIERTVTVDAPGLSGAGMLAVHAISRLGAPFPSSLEDPLRQTLKVLSSNLKRPEASSSVVRGAMEQLLVLLEQLLGDDCGFLPAGHRSVMRVACVQSLQRIVGSMRREGVVSSRGSLAMLVVSSFRSVLGWPFESSVAVSHRLRTEGGALGVRQLLQVQNGCASLTDLAWATVVGMDPLELSDADVARRDPFARVAAMVVLRAATDAASDALRDAVDVLFRQLESDVASPHAATTVDAVSWLYRCAGEALTAVSAEPMACDASHELVRDCTERLRGPVLLDETPPPSWETIGLRRCWASLTRPWTKRTMMVQAAAHAKTSTLQEVGDAPAFALGTDARAVETVQNAVSCGIALRGVMPRLLVYPAAPECLLRALVGARLAELAAWERQVSHRGETAPFSFDPHSEWIGDARRAFLCLVRFGLDAIIGPSFRQAPVLGVSAGSLASLVNGHCTLPVPDGPSQRRRVALHMRVLEEWRSFEGRRGEIDWATTAEDLHSRTERTLMTALANAEPLAIERFRDDGYALKSDEEGGAAGDGLLVDEDPFAGMKVPLPEALPFALEGVEVLGASPDLASALVLAEAGVTPFAVESVGRGVSLGASASSGAKKSVGRGVLPTHFTCVRLAARGLWGELAGAHEMMLAALSEERGALRKMMVHPCDAHLTLNVLCLLSDAAVDRASLLVAQVLSTRRVGRVTVTMKRGVQAFRKGREMSVLHVEPVGDEGMEALSGLFRELELRFRAEALTLDVVQRLARDGASLADIRARQAVPTIDPPAEEPTTFTPHCTLAKASKLRGRAPRGALEAAAAAVSPDQEWSACDVDRVLLCRMQGRVLDPAESDVAGWGGFYVIESAAEM
jgi:2'-5' RNA ligase